MDVVTGAVGWLDFELEQFNSSGEMEFSTQWQEGTPMFQDIVKVIGAVGAKFYGFLQGLSDGGLVREY
jgi:hypothetical protein